MHRLTTLLPEVTLAGAVETTRIYSVASVAGLTAGRTALLTTWPFRAATTPSPMWG